MKVIEIAFTGYPVTDLKRARRFYEGTLGLQQSRLFGNDDHGWVEYDIGPGTVSIGNMAPDWKPSSNGGAVAFEVENFEEALGRLKADGVTITAGPFDTPVCHMVVLLDPDGNSLLIHKRKAQS
jgi:predicted enzyme related to lactoylglutathione lyase